GCVADGNGVAIAMAHLRDGLLGVSKRMSQSTMTDVSALGDLLAHRPVGADVAHAGDDQLLDLGGRGTRVLAAASWRGWGLPRGCGRPSSGRPRRGGPCPRSSSSAARTAAVDQALEQVLGVAPAPGAARAWPRSA